MAVASVPEMVPLPNRSPGSQIAAVRRMVRNHLRHRPVQIACIAIGDSRCGSAPAARIAGVASNTSHSMSKRAVRLVGGIEQMRQRRADRRRAAPAARCGTAAIASAVMIHGETDVRKLFPRNGPSGCDSHDWISRADQSFSRQKPAICSGLADRNRLIQLDCRRRSRRQVPTRNRDSGTGRSRRRPRQAASLAVRPPHRLARWSHRRSAAVISDRHILVVRHQRIVRPR